MTANTNTISELANLKNKLCEGYTNQIISHMVNAGCITEDEVQDHYADILSILTLGKTSPNTILFTKKVRRKKKDPNVPKRPANAWLLFKSAKYQEIKDSLADEGVEITIGTTSKRASSMWKALSKDDKKPYEDEYTQKNTSYQEELEAYKESNPAQEDEIVTPKRKRKKKSNVEPCPTAVPEEFVGEWLGPFESTFLCGSVKGVVFSTLDEALTAANERPDCVGVTRSNRGYSIRFGYKDSRPPFQGTGIENYEDLLYPSPTNEVSFIKQTASDNYKAHGPNEKTSSSSDESVQKSKKKSNEPKKKSKFTVVSCKKPQQSASKTLKKSSKKKKQPIQKTPPTPPAQLKHESDTEDSGDLIDTKIDTNTHPEVKVIKETIDGVEYYLDTKSCKVYDLKTEDFVGKLENGSVNFDTEDSESDFSD